MGDFDLATEQARVAELHGQADEVMAGLRAKVAAVAQAQQTALSVTGEASSRDGSVRAVVDATGVVTSLVFAASAFERSTPEKLAQATIFTIQAAAAQARARVSETLAPAREPGSRILAAAEDAFPELSARQLSVPEVPRTATDPADEADPWHDARPKPARPAESTDDETFGSSIFDKRGW
jgi:hypothetical protein